ncbi:DUF5681 domain-containing protein [Mesorhizobium marinum]|uniref:DUF5681 domain-containing protein n=1 Tax=Mesorhizobium marinum TaxID=3228790 RepID=UPI003465A498
MTSEDEKKLKALAVRPTDPAYEIGYGKPPATTRFKPGQSGNPRGRPKGSSNRPKPPARNEERMKSILLEEAYRTIKVNEGAGQISVPMAQAVIRSLAVNAVKGNQRAQRLFTELLFTAERENKRLNDEWLNAAITYKVEWERELMRRERLGIIAPDPLPHPDHVVIDMRTGQVAIKGPMTKEEKEQWDIWHDHQDLMRTELEEYKAEAARTRSAARLQELQAEIAQTEQVLSIMDLVFETGRIPAPFPKLEPLK